jgi:hypothetical protein
MTVTVRYQVGTYKGEVNVNADENAEEAHIIALAKKQLFRNGTPGPMYYEHYEIIREGE